MRSGFREGLRLRIRRALPGLAFVAVLLIGVWVAAGFQADRLARARLHAVVRALGPEIRLAWSRVTANPLTRSMTLKGVRLGLPGGVTARIGRVSVGGAVMGDGALPRALTLDCEDVVLPPSPSLFGATAGVLDDLGYGEALRLDVRLAYSFDPDAHRLMLRPLEIRARDMGHMRLEAELGNVDLDQWRTGFFLGTELICARITYFDRSLAERVLVFTSLATARPRDEVVEDWAAGLRLQARLARGEKNDRAARALTALVPFVRSRDGLAASLNPEEPVPLLYWYMGRNHRDMLDLFNPDIRVFDQSNVKNYRQLDTETSDGTV